MQVSKELRDTIHEAVIMALDAYAQDTDVDVHIVDAVEAVLQEVAEPEIKTPGLVAVKYVGRRPRYSDGNWETGWWDYGQTKMVVEATATKMLVHKGVYEPGDTTGEIAEVPAKEKNDLTDPLQDTKDALMNMNRKAAVAEFVANNFSGLKIPEEYKTLADMKAFAVQKMTIYGLP